jgi:transposase
VRQKLWHHVSNGEEDQARRMLNRHLFDCGAHPTEPARNAIERVPLSDIRFVAHVSRNLRDHGHAGDPFDAVAKQDPRWTRQRWNQAMRAWLAPRRHWSVTQERSYRHPPETFSAPFTS